MKLIVSCLILFIIPALTVLTVNGCKDEDGIIDGSIPFNYEALTARAFSEVYNVFSHAETYIVMKSQNQNTNSTGCPTVSSSGTFENGTLSVDYGTVPCISVYEQTRRSGAYYVNYSIDSTLDRDSVYMVVSFDNYKVYRIMNSIDTTVYLQLNGTGIVSGKKISQNVFNLNMNTDVTVTSKNINQNIKINNFISLDIYAHHDPFDDIFTMNGSAIITDIKYNKQLSYQIDNIYNMMLFNYCRYPVTGLITLTDQSKITTIDLTKNNSQCDEFIGFNSGNKSYVVNMEELNF